MQNDILGTSEMALSEDQVILSPGLDVDLEEYYDYDVNVEVRYLISARHAGGIIGKKGAYINQLRQKADVEFLVHKAVPNTPLRTGSVRGSVRNVVHALLLMADKVSELQKASRRISRSDYLFQYGDYSVTLLLEHKNCGVIIGKRGARISCNRQRSGAHIKISTHVLENSSEKTVDIQGTREAVENALETLVVQIANNPKPNVEPNKTNRKYLDQSHNNFPKRHHQYLRHPHNNLSHHQHQPHRNQHQPPQQPFYNPMSYLGYHYTTPSNYNQNWNQQSFYQTTRI
jgi:predicted PilT family ATPase